MRVVPEKPWRSPDERAAEYRELADSRNVLNLEIGGPAVVAAHVRQNRERARRDDRTADCQPNQPIRQVHRVGGTDNDDGRSHQEGHERQRPEVPGKMRFVEQRMNHQIGMESLQKRKDELRRVSTVGGQDKKHDANNQADESLKINFLLRGETQIALIRDFRVIIDEANDRKTEKRKKRKQDKRIGQIRPRRTGTAVERTMSTPPMVGVPAFFWCAWGPSSRMNWPICNSRRFRISQGPKTSARNIAVRLAYTVRTVM